MSCNVYHLSQICTLFGNVWNIVLYSVFLYYKSYIYPVSSSVDICRIKKAAACIHYPMQWAIGKYVIYLCPEFCLMYRLLPGPLYHVYRVCPDLLKYCGEVEKSLPLIIGHKNKQQIDLSQEGPALKI